MLAPLWPSATVCHSAAGGHRCTVLRARLPWAMWWRYVSLSVCLSFGSWRTPVYCSAGTFAMGYAMKVQCMSVCLSVLRQLADTGVLFGRHVCYGICDEGMSVCLSVCLSVCPSAAGGHRCTVLQARLPWDMWWRYVSLSVCLSVLRQLEDTGVLSSRHVCHGICDEGMSVCLSVLRQLATPVYCSPGTFPIANVPGGQYTGVLQLP